MSHRILNLFLLCSFLFTSVFSAGEASAWVCDGRICSTADTCCCVSEVKQDPRCLIEPAPRGRDAICKAACGCTLVIKADAPDPSALPAHFNFHPVVAVLPLSPFCWVAPLEAQSALLPIAARGPPAGSIALATPSLRAPPVA